MSPIKPEFFHPGTKGQKDPGSRNQGQKDPGSRFRVPVRIKEFEYFNPKKPFLSSRKNDLGCSFRIRIPDPGVKKAPDPDPHHMTIGMNDM